MKTMLSLVGVLGLATTAVAGPIPALPAAGPVLGESDIHSFSTPADNVNIDWIVMDAGVAGLGAPGHYAYLYQVENGSTGTHVDIFSITLGAKEAGVVSHGVLFGTDLDAFGPLPHAVGGEEEGFAFTSIATGATTLGGGTLTYSVGTAASLLIGEESDLIYFVHPDPPVYGQATLQNAVPPSPWATAAPGSDLVPVPGDIIIPVPAAAWMGFALLGGIAVNRKLKRA